MILFCGKCVDNHDIKPSKVEAIVYALQAAELDALQDPNAVKERGRDPECLIDIADGADHPELYYEHVTAFISKRRYLQQTGRKP